MWKAEVSINCCEAARKWAIGRPSRRLGGGDLRAFNLVAQSISGNIIQASEAELCRGGSRIGGADSRLTVGGQGLKLSISGDEIEAIRRYLEMKSTPAE